MRVAAWMETFPALSETYILWHMAELLRHGVALTLYPARRGRTDQLQEEVRELDMMRLIQAPPNLETGADRSARVRQALEMTARALARHPALVLRLLPQLRGPEHVGWFQAIPHLSALQVPASYDVLQGYFGPSARRAALLRRIGAVEGALVATFLGFDLNVLGQRLGGEYYRHVFERAERITVSSEFMWRKLIELGAPQERAVILPLGLPIARFEHSPRLAPTDGPVRVVTAARLTEVKGIEWGLRALAIAKARGADLRWDILGDGPLRGPLQQLAHTLGLADQVIFHGAQPMGRVRELLAQAHLSMLPGVRASDGAEEALGGAVIEAQACGLPVLATDAGGIAEGLIHDVSGLCVPQRDPEAIALGLLTLIERAAQWPQMGLAGRAHVQARYDCATLHERWMALYRSL